MGTNNEITKQVNLGFAEKRRTALTSEIPGSPSLHGDSGFAHINTARQDRSRQLPLLNSQIQRFKENVGAEELFPIKRTEIP